MTPRELADFIADKLTGGGFGECSDTETGPQGASFVLTYLDGMRLRLTVAEAGKAG